MGGKNKEKKKSGHNSSKNGNNNHQMCLEDSMEYNYNGRYYWKNQNHYQNAGRSGKNYYKTEKPNVDTKNAMQFREHNNANQSQDNSSQSVDLVPSPHFSNTKLVPNKPLWGYQSFKNKNSGKNQITISFCLDCDKVVCNKDISYHRGHNIVDFQDGMKHKFEMNMEKAKQVFSEVEKLQKAQNDTISILDSWNSTLKYEIDYALNIFQNDVQQNVLDLTNADKAIGKLNSLAIPKTILENCEKEKEINGTVTDCQNLISRVNHQPSWLIGNFFKTTLGIILQTKSPVICAIRSNINPKFSRLELMGDRILLHSFTSISPTSSNISAPTLIPFELVSALLERDDSQVFMKLSYDHKELGNILIRVEKESYSGQQFLMLCTGENGPSYRNSSFFRSCWKGKPGHHIWGGDYSRNDGSGGESVLKGNVTSVPSPKLVTEGLISARYGHNDRSSIFRIYLKGMKSNKSQSSFSYSSSSNDTIVDKFSFGQVQEGLDILNNISDKVDISKAKISEVGRVLSLS